MSSPRAHLPGTCAKARRPPTGWGACEANSAQVCANASRVGRRWRAPAGGPTAVRNLGAAWQAGDERGSGRPAAAGACDCGSAWTPRPQYLCSHAQEHSITQVALTGHRARLRFRGRALVCAGVRCCLRGRRQRHSGVGSRAPGAPTPGWRWPQARVGVNPSLNKRQLRCDSHRPRCDRQVLGVLAPLLPKGTRRCKRSASVALLRDHV